MTRVMQPTDRDRLHTKQAEAEELRCRNAIQAAGWTIVRSVVRPFGTHMTIMREGQRAGCTFKYGAPGELARQVQDRHRQRQEQ
jgi:hypothetical protein